jgi:hypothetical protein
MSLRMLDCAGISAADALIDVGGGASPFTGVLLDRGFRDLTVLDISAVDSAASVPAGMGLPLSGSPLPAIISGCRAGRGRLGPRRAGPQSLRMRGHVTRRTSRRTHSGRIAR